MGAAERAADIHRALTSLYDDGIPLDAGLRPSGTAGASVAVAVGDRRVAEAIAGHLRGAPGVAGAAAVAGAGAARVDIHVSPRLAWAALECLLRRPPIARADPAPAAHPPPPASPSPATELIVAAQLAHAACHRRLRRAARLLDPPIGPEHPALRMSAPPPRTADPGHGSPDPDPHEPHIAPGSAEGTSRATAQSAGRAPGAAAGHLLCVLADQPRLLGPHRLTDNPRALTEHLRALTAVTGAWLQELEELPEPAEGAELLLTQGALRALADALHTLDEPAPARF